MAFHHPHPSYPVHILLVPKKSIASLVDLPAGDGGLLGEFFQVVQYCIEQFNLQSRGYRLVINGGPYQDVPQLHAHLISEK